MNKKEKKNGYVAVIVTLVLILGIFLSQMFGWIGFGIFAVIIIVFTVFILIITLPIDPPKKDFYNPESSSSRYGY